MKLPFYLTLQGFLLKGQAREEAKIEYELEGELKDRALLALNYSNPDLQQLPEYKIKKLEIDKKYNKINDFEYDLELNKINKLNKTEEEVQLQELELYLKYNKISNVEYCKKKNDILKKPWVAIHTNYDETNNPDDMEVEVAYNKTFIEHMRNKGLPGETEEEIAEQWLKLFFISNLEEDDLKMISSEEEEETPQQVIKLANNSTIKF